LLLLATQVTSPFAILTNLSPPETVDLLSPSIKLLKRYPHFRPEITSLSQRIFLEFFEPCLPVQVIGDSLGNINQGLVCPLNLHISRVGLFVSSTAIRVVLDRQFSECLLDLIAGCLFINLQQLIEVGLSLTKCDYGCKGEKDHQGKGSLHDCLYFKYNTSRIINIY
jgi:hypothetical protein